MRILLSGGGTGGHVYPILAVLDALQAQFARTPSARLQDETRQAVDPIAVRSTTNAGSVPRKSADMHPPASIQFKYVGEAGGIEQMLAERAGISFVAVSTGQIRGRAPWEVTRNLGRMRHGAVQCAQLIAAWRPDVVFMTGGYVAAPVAWAAYRARPRAPLLIYLPDLTPGQAIRVTSRLAEKVAVSFKEVCPYFGDKAVVTGYPVRADLFTMQKPEARAAMGVSADLPVLLVFGGSRGARSINQAFVSALPDLLAQCQVVHIA